MSLTPGTRLGSYDILGPLGAGGMGEVYRARDTRLGREVALKVLPQAFVADQDRVARFEREARALAALNHPNIATLYGMELADGQHLLVMELVEGPTLAERISGPMPLSLALAIAVQIATALEAAHEGGIIHRDLKPANVKITADDVVKVLDFGLAKAVEPPGAPASDEANSPTLTARATQLGLILGTAAYMAPEQARGRTVDKRADVFAFGAVLFEMLSGRRAFEGDDVTDVMASVLKSEPDWAALPASTPPTIVKLLHRALEKDRRNRLPDIAMARLEIEDARAHRDDNAVGPAADPRLPPWRRAAPFAATAVVATMATAAVMSLARPAPEARSLTVSIPLPTDARLASDEPDEVRIGGHRPSQPSIDWLPDGSALVLGAAVGADVRLYLRLLDAEAAIAIAGTEGGHSPAVSPDGRSIAFVTGRGLMVVPVGGGTPRLVCEDPSVESPRWIDDQTIVYVADPSTVYRIRTAGGTPEALLGGIPERPGRLRLPEPLANGSVLVTVMQPGTQPAIYALPPGGEPALVLEDGTAARLHGDLLLFAREGALMAARVDLETLRITAGPVVAVDGVVHTLGERNGSINTGAAQFAISGAGLALARGGLSDATPAVWVRVDRSGRELPFVRSRAGLYPRLSPDQLWFAFDRSAEGERDVVIQNVATGAERRLALPASQRRPIWSPDGQSLAFVSFHAGLPERVFVRRADGSDEPRQLGGGSGVAMYPEAWVDEHTIVGLAASRTLLAVDVRDGTTREIATGVSWPALSHDGRWIAMTNEADGSIEVRPYPAGAPVYRVAEAGTRAAWSRDGRELFFRTGLWDRHTMMAIDVRVEGDQLITGRPRELFTGAYGGAIPVRSYDVFSDGTFLMYPEVAVEVQPVRQVQLRLGWIEEISALLGREGR